MQHQRRTLSLKAREPSRPDGAVAVAIRDAISGQRCLFAIYNRGQVRFAPYILYTRHDELYVDGVVMDRDGKPPRELRLATFKLDGLTAVRPLDERFEQEIELDPADPKYLGTTVLTLGLSRAADQG